MNHIRGLDSIRALCALWVVMGHFGAPPLLVGVPKSNTLELMLHGIFNNLWSGPPAVIAFFVISGLCIHHPQVQTLRLVSLPAYFTRRFVRVGLPMAAAIALSFPLRIDLSLLDKTVMWSLVAELIYYSIYPALLALRRRANSWTYVLAASFAAAIGVACIDPGAKDYPSYGAGLNWLLGLPCWILGCALSEHAQRSPVQAAEAATIWKWRIGVFGTAALTSMLRFHSPLGYPWTLNLFAILVALWLHQEIIHFTRNASVRWLEWIGQWSYSIYLGHVLAYPVFKLLVPDKPTWLQLGPQIDWVLMMAFILFGSYCFYLAIERPAHLVARFLGRSLALRASLSAG